MTETVTDLAMLEEMLVYLNDNYKIAMTSFNRCPPQNPRDYQVCDSVRTTMNMIEDILKYLIRSEKAKLPIVTVE